MLTQRLSTAVSASSHSRVLDRSKVVRTPPLRYLNCKACIFQWARQRGTKLVLVTRVQKENRLILMVNMALIATADPGKKIAGGSLDLQGDTDATWLAGASQMQQRTMGVTMTP